MSPVLALEDLSVVTERRVRRVAAFSNVSLEVGAGAVTVMDGDGAAARARARGEVARYPAVVAELG